MDQVSLFKPGCLTPPKTMAQPSAADGWDMPVDHQLGHFIGTALNTPLSTATTISMVPPDMHDVPHQPPHAVTQEEQGKAIQQVAQHAHLESCQAQLAQQAAPVHVAQQAQLDAQQAALFGNCAGINGALALTPQPGHVEVTKCMPQPVETLSEDEWQTFRQVLEDHGLDPDAGDKIECGQLKLGYRPMQVCQDMEHRYANCPYHQWDWPSVPARQNPQMYLVVKYMMEMFTAADQVYGKILWAVVANGKLLTAWYQHVRSTTARTEYMAYDHPGQQFNYHRHNEGFKKYCKEWSPQCLKPFPGSTDGIWECLFATKLLVTVVIKMDSSSKHSGRSLTRFQSC